MRYLAHVVLLVLIALALASCQTTGTGVRFKTSQMDDSGVVVSALTFKPEGKGPFPAVVLLHTCGGYQQHVTQDWPAFLTGLGYYVVSVSSYRPRGYSYCYEGRGVTLAQAADAYGALAYLRTRPEVDADRVAVMGFSAGGFAINDYVVSARRVWQIEHDFKAAISLYAGCNGLIGTYGEDSMPLLQIAGEEDLRLAASCEYAASVTAVELHVIDGAYHAFDQPQIKSIRSDNKGNPMLYSYVATREAQELTKVFLAKHLR